MDKKFRFYEEGMLDLVLSNLKEIPEVYVKNYKGKTQCIDYNELKLILGLPKSKTFSTSYKELSKLADDLGYKTGNTVEFSKHSAWVWFNFDGVWEGYSEDVQAKKRLEYQQILAEKKQELDKTVLDGTYGLNNKDEGGVYLISCGDYYKIGFSKNIKTRVSSIQTSSPYDVELVTKYSSFYKNHEALESHLHSKFKEHHHRLEWFRKGFTPEEFLALCVEFCRSK